LPHIEPLVARRGRVTAYPYIELSNGPNSPNRSLTDDYTRLSGLLL
jgi:hypothetical protein